MTRKGAATLCFIADGSSVHTERWLNWFAERDYHVHLFTDTDFNGSRAVEVHKMAPPSGVKRSHRLLSALRSGIKATDADVIHAHFVAGYGHLAWMAGVRPYIVTAWGSDVLQGQRLSWRTRLLTSRTLRGAAYCTGDSPSLVARLRTLGVPESRLGCVGFGVDVERFRPLEVHAARRALEVPNEGPVVLSARSVRPLYNTRTIIAAFEQVRRRFPLARLIIKDYFGDATYRAKVRDDATRLDIADAVTWIDRVEHATMPWLYAAADVVVSAASTDSAPLTMWESFACERPLIASDIPGLREYYEPEDRWLLASPHSPAEVARALTRALELDGEGRRSIVARYRQMAVQHASVEVEMARVGRLYDALARGVPNPSLG